MKPSALLEESRVLLGIPGGTPKEKIIKMLVDIALDGRPDLSAAVCADLQKREDVMSTGIGLGIAIPHTHTTLVAKPTAALGVSREGVEWHAVDGEPVNVIFALITPEEEPKLHVQALGATAALFGDSDTRKKILKAATAAEILEILRKHEG